MKYRYSYPPPCKLPEIRKNPDSVGAEDDILSSKNRLDELEEKIEKAKNKGRSAENGPEKNSVTIPNICSEILAGVAVGGVIGYFLDSLLGTKPFLFASCFILGAFSSFWVIFKMINKDDEE